MQTLPRTLLFLLALVGGCYCRSDDSATPGITRSESGTVIAERSHAPSESPPTGETEPEKSTVVSDHSAEPELQDLSSITDSRYTFVTIPAGSFWQGCNESLDTHCSDNEYPYREVNMPSYEIGVTEVTVSQFSECVDSGECTKPRMITGCNFRLPDREDHPVNCVNWYQSRDYCEWIGARLCSESEWEKAARGADGRIYPWGNENATCERAVMFELRAGCGEGLNSWPVGSKPAGIYGLFDMAGNVLEWVEDDWHDDYTGAPTDGSAWVEEPRLSERVVRGGCFAYGPRSLRASYRLGGLNPSVGLEYNGLRCCRSIMP